MIAKEDSDKIKDIIDTANIIVVIQADNPDADSIGSALALEELLENQGKQTVLYCSVDMPSYLSYVAGIDRVTNDMPKNFDASIIVDASTKTLLERLESSGELAWVAAKPCVVLDHHESVQNPIDFAEVSVIDTNAASAGVIIHELSKALSWEITDVAAESLLVSILGDTQGLSNNLATADTYRVVADLIDAGADRPKLEEMRREQSKMPRKIFDYKGELIRKTRFSDSGMIAMVSISQHEINTYSPLYNPAPLIQGDLLQTEGVSVAIVVKIYDSGRITGSIRCNNSASIANKLAETFGGGGHPYAAGFKIENSQNSDDVKKEVIIKAEALLKALNETA